MEQNLASRIVDIESRSLSELGVLDRLMQITRSETGLKLFAESFYFIRSDFCRINFIVGAKCPPHEKYWSGLVRNLVEELGGTGSDTHNELYRYFLMEAAGVGEDFLVSPKFCADFNCSWETFCRESPYELGLLALGFYEALDQVDYQMLQTCVRASGVSSRGARFFEVHAQAEHYQLFGVAIDGVLRTEFGRALAEKAISFVAMTQRKMWGDLLEWLEERCKPALPGDRVGVNAGICISANG